MEISKDVRFVKILLLALFFLLLQSSFTWPLPIYRCAGSSTPILYISPSITVGSPTTVGTDSVPQLVISVMVASVPNLIGYQFTLVYNTTLLTYVNVGIRSSLFFPSTIPGKMVDITGGTISVTSDEGDITGKGIVGLDDLVILSKAYGSKPGDPNWNPSADLDSNGAVSLTDLVIIANNYEKTNQPVNVPFMTLATITFKETYETPYGQPKDSCALGIVYDKLWGAGFSPITHITSNGTYSASYASPSISLTLNSASSNYHFGDKIDVYGNVFGNGYPVTDDAALVALEIQNPRSNTVAIRTLSTGNFTSWSPVQILGLTPLQNNFDATTPGIMYFTVTVKNNEATNLNALIMVNAYDSNNASLGVNGVNQLIPAQSTQHTATVQLELPLNNAMASGGAIVYASVLSGPVENGGIPLCPESSAQFTISGTAQGEPFSPTPTQGTYETVLTIPSYFGQTGGYSIYAGATFLGSNATRNITIQIS